MKLDLTKLEINSSLKFKVMYFAGALMHITFFVLFAISKIHTMMYFNIFSVLLYITGAIMSGHKKYEQTALGWMIALYCEITVHGFLATLLLGTEVGFYLYIMMVLPVGAYMLFFTCDRRVFWKIMPTLTVVTLVVLCVILKLVNKNGPLMYSLYGRELGVAEKNTMLSINVFFNTVLIGSFTLMFILEIATLVNRLNATNEQLSFTATHDALTGLFNRHSLRNFFAELESSNQPFCVLLGDIDDFKKVNDTYGHDCGDLVLKTVAEIISAEMMSGDLACRWGGEEILIIFRGSRMDCLSRANLVRNEIIERTMTHEDKKLKVTMTFGFVDNTELREPPSDGISRVEALISLADKRLYKGKTSGKNVIISKN